MTTWTWELANVTRIVDGDTLVARVTRDLGFHGTASFDVRLRLNRINAPPAKSPDGMAAMSYLMTMLAPHVRVTVQTVGPYKYGDEWMAEVTLPDGINVSDELVSRGHAAYWDGHGQRPGG